MGIRLVARCVHGLESVVAAEILSIGLGSIVELGHREIHCDTAQPETTVQRLRTADDAFVLVATTPDIGRTKGEVAALTELVTELDAPALREARRRCGGPAEFGAGIAVSASFLGRRNFNRYDVEDTVGAALSERLGLQYHSRRNGARPPDHCSGWRVVLDGRRARLMLRIAVQPLHRRAYKLQSVPGSLHPPVASAMVQLADLRAGDWVLDPCCGAGTLLVEAMHAQPDARYSGFDIDPAAVCAIRANAANTLTTGSADAANVPLPQGSIDRIVCNPPWGGQVPARGRLTHGSTPLWAELRRLIATDGTAVVLIPDTRELAIAIRAGFHPTHLQQIRNSGKHSFIVRLTPNRERNR
ncbi:methyltransferase domain-containing protein [Nocardia sp. XZ_19_369]|uniref:methyltransferase domain-containing protein n=1 Tax=Nocardia sp. XZ_19_369 TaxID=2769487 RepID=UPI00188DE376|nr:methyltransferase domain-containing protein [Nocardia sp. XZ_19_369]